MHTATSSRSQPAQVNSAPFSVHLQRSRHPNLFPHNINFAAPAESEESSPTIPPSTSSTVNTYPTPLSETTSSRPNSILHTSRDPSNSITATSYPRSSQSHHHGSQTLDPKNSSSNSNTLSRTFEDQLDSIPAADSPSSSDTHHQGSTPTDSADLSDIQNINEHTPRTMSHEIVNDCINHFDDPLFSDCILYLTVRGVVLSLFLHRIFLSRSSTLSHLLSTAQNRDGNGRLELHWGTNNPHVNIEDFVAALRTLYGVEHMAYLTEMYGAHNVALFDDRAIFHVLSPAMADPNSGALLHVLSYLVTSVMLGLEPVITRCLNLVIPAISFDNLETILVFATTGNLFPGFKSLTSDAASMPASPVLTHYSARLLYSIVNFIMSSTPFPFSLDTEAPSSIILGEPPHHPGTTHSLRAIRFGDLPPPPTRAQSFQASFCRCRSTR